MTVYVDDMRAEFRGMVMCHMLADSEQELLAMAALIGVNRRWHQLPGTPRSHFDICMSKRAAAIRRGAIEITQRDAVRIVRSKRSPGAAPAVVGGDGQTRFNF
mgnify:CR=1 FL=1